MQEITSPIHPTDNPCAFAISQIDCREIKLVGITNPFWLMTNFVEVCKLLELDAYINESSNVGTFASIMPLPLSIKDLRTPIAEIGFVVYLFQEESDYKLMHENCIIVLTAFQYVVGILAVKFMGATVEYDKTYTLITFRTSWI